MIQYIRNAEELIATLTDADAKRLLDILKIENQVHQNAQQIILENYNEINREVIDNFYQNVFEDFVIEYTRFAFGHYHNQVLPNHIYYLAEYFDRKRYNYRISLNNGEMILQKSHFEKFAVDFLWQFEWISLSKEVNCRIFMNDFVLLTPSEVVQISRQLSRAEKLKKLRNRAS